MAVAFVNVGTRGAGTAGASPGIPAGMAAGDIMVFFAETGLGENVPAMAGWTEAPNSPIHQGTNTGLTVRYRLWQSGDAAPATGDPGNHILCQIAGFSGVDNTTPWDVATSATGTETTDTTANIPNVTTVTDGAMVISAVATQDDNLLAEAGGLFSGWTNASLVSITEGIDITTALGDDGGLGMGYGIKTTAGAVNNTDVTVPVNLQKAMWGNALRPAGGAAFVPLDDFGMNGIFGI